MTVRDRRWQDEAACSALPARTADLLFFGTDRALGQGVGQVFTRRDLIRARAICERCPVLWHCLDDALATPPSVDRHGLRAGLLPAERETLREGEQVDGVEAAVTYLGGQPGAPTQRQRRRSA